MVDPVLQCGADEVRAFGEIKTQTRLTGSAASSSKKANGCTMFGVRLENRCYQSMKTSIFYKRDAAQSAGREKLEQRPTA